MLNYKCTVVTGRTRGYVGLWVDLVASVGLYLKNITF